MLVRCLYASQRSSPIDETALEDILLQSRRNNAELGVTGLLCVADNLFIQVLEGGRDEVCGLYNKIVQDERHSQVRLLVYEEISERQFGSWTMGHVDADKLNPAMLLKYFRRPKLDPFGSSGAATMSLLSELVASASIANRGE